MPVKHGRRRVAEQLGDMGVGYTLFHGVDGEGVPASSAVEMD